MVRVKVPFSAIAFAKPQLAFFSPLFCSSVRGKPSLGHVLSNLFKSFLSSRPVNTKKFLNQPNSGLNASRFASSLLTVPTAPYTPFSFDPRRQSHREPFVSFPLAWRPKKSFSNPPIAQNSFAIGAYSSLLHWPDFCPTRFNALKRPSVLRW
jgi:hypothetical protein